MANHKEHPEHAEPHVSAEAVASHQRRRHALEARDLYKAAGLLFLLALAYRFFDQLAQVFLLSYAAALLAVGVNAILGWIPIKRKWLAALTGLAVVGGFVALVWWGLPALLSQMRGLTDLFPAVQEKLAQWERWIEQQTGLSIPSAGGGGSLPAPSGGAGQVFGQAMTVLEMLLIPLLIFFGGLFALASPNDRLLTPVLRAVRPDLRPAFYRIFQLMGERIVGWLRGTLAAMVSVGVLSVAAWSLIGVPNALALGLFNGLVEFIPLVGPWVGGLTATLAALVEDPTKALWTALSALAIQQVEANLITPYAMSRAADVHPFVTLFALVLFGGIFGFLGILLALPLVLLVWTVVQVLWVERTIDTDRDRIAPVVPE